MKEVYFIRHSIPMKVNNDLNSESLQVQDEKRVLSVEGEQLAANFFNNSEFDNIDVVYSSNYVRAIATSKYLALKNNVGINIISGFGERVVGIKSWDEYPENFELNQFNDNNYKLPNGESLNEVQKRELEALNIVLNTNYKRIAVVFHSTAMMILLKKWCQVSYNSDYYFKGKSFFDGKWNYCETFKLVFDDNNELQEITNIR